MDVFMSGSGLESRDGRAAAQRFGNERVRFPVQDAAVPVQHDAALKQESFQLQGRAHVEVRLDLGIPQDGAALNDAAPANDGVRADDAVRA